MNSYGINPVKLNTKFQSCLHLIILILHITLDLDRNQNKIYWNLKLFMIKKSCNHAQGYETFPV